MSICKTILSLNVRGLCDLQKRQEKFRWLKQNHNGSECIIFLQEAHSVENDCKIWQHDWGSEIFNSHGSSNSRGVAILLPLNYTFNIINTTTSSDGRKIVMNIELDGTEYCLMNVYAPTQDMEKDQLLFINDLVNNIESNLENKLIIGSDFNLPLTFARRDSNALLHF